MNIVKEIGRGEVLAQLAEEAAELSQAALKLRRAVSGVNPTPVSMQAAERHVFEEWADCVLCFDMLFPMEEHLPRYERCRQTIIRKRRRWKKRLRKARSGLQ